MPGEGLMTVTAYTIEDTGEKAAQEFAEAVLKNGNRLKSLNSELDSIFKASGTTESNITERINSFRGSGRSKMEFTGELKGKTDNEIAEILKNKDSSLYDDALSQVTEMKHSSELARGDKKFAKGIYDNTNRLRAAGKEQDIALSKSILQKSRELGITGDFLEGVGGDMEKALKKRLKSLSGKTDEEINALGSRLQRFAESNAERHPRLMRYLGLGLGAYGLLLLFENSDSDCQQKCITGDEAWVKLHSNYTEFCSDKSSQNCVEYCNPKKGGSDDTANAAGDEAACSPASRMDAEINRVENHVAHAAGGAADKFLDIIKKLLLGPLGKFLGAVCACICFGIIGFTAISMIMSGAKKKVVNSMVGDTFRNNSLIQNSIQNAKTLNSKIGGSLYKDNYNKYVILFIFFIFIIYNDFRRN